MPTKKTPREIADQIDFEQSAPLSNKYIDVVGNRIDKMDDGPLKEAATGLGLAGMTLPFIGDMVVGNKTRSREDRAELAREIARGEKKAKGGSISSASKRADGIAVKGKTRGRMV